MHRARKPFTWSRARRTLRLGPPRQSSAELGRATGARPMPHSALTSLSARRAVVASLSLPRSAERKVTLATGRAYWPLCDFLSSEAARREKTGVSRGIRIWDTLFTSDLGGPAVVKVTATVSLKTRLEGLSSRIGAKTMTARMTWGWPRASQQVEVCSFSFLRFSSPPSLVTRVCAWFRVCSWSRRLIYGDGPARSCETSLSTMIIEPSSVKRTVVTGDRIRGECRVVWLLSPRIFHSVRLWFVFSFSSRLYVCVQIAKTCEETDHLRNFMNDIRPNDQYGLCFLYEYVGLFSKC